MKSIFRTFLQGIVVLAPAVLTIFVCVQAILWVDESCRAAMKALDLPVMPGVGVALALVGIYLVGLLTRTWMFRQLVRLGESIVERIPLVKSLYSAVKDLLQFLSGTDARTRGVPARIKLFGGNVHMMGLITQKEPESFLGEEARDRVAIYLPMSYQIGGFTVYVPQEQIEEIPELTVEEVLKLSMTAGIGKKEDLVDRIQQEQSPEQAPTEADATDPAEDEHEPGTNA